MPHILFICTANIIRSPIAEALLRRKISRLRLPGEWQVASAGTWAASGRPAASESRRLIKEFGLDLESHRSRVVTADILAEADLILTMEHGHKEALRAEFPQAANRIFLLSEMSGFSADVPDPLGGTSQDYKETIREIYHLIERGFPKIYQAALENARS